MESHGEGGICHYTYCLANALAEKQHDVVVASAFPYELAEAPRRFTLVTPFGQSHERRLLQRLRRSLHVAPSTGPSAPRDDKHPTNLTTSIVSAASTLEGAHRGSFSRLSSALVGAGSRLLAQREYRTGLRITQQLLQQFDIELAHVQWCRSPPDDLRWLSALRQRRIPAVLTAHNTLPHDAPDMARETWAYMYQTARQVIAHSPTGRAELLAMGVQPDHVTVIPHGNYIPLSALAATDSGGGDSARRQMARRQLGLAADAPVLLCFGLMRPYKGINYLLEAFAHVAQALPTARLLLVGNAPDGFASIARQIVSLRLEHAVTAIPRYVSLEDASLCFMASDLVALPYVEASQSGVIQLAYAYRRPVVATRVGGLPEVVVEGETGALVPPRDAGALSRVLVAFLGDPDNCHRLGMRAYEYAETTYAWTNIASTTLDVYARAQGAHQPSIR